MKKKIFVLGLPGSGKSTAARLIEGIARDLQWLPNKFNDYEVLQEMFLKDDAEQFSFADGGGFDVHDHQVFDVALQQLEKNVQGRSLVQDRNEIIIIEFSRNDYYEAFKLFSPGFLRNSLFLFIDADIQTCIERIQRRRANPTYPDDHPVSEYIFESYYFKDDRQYAARFETYNIDKGAATVIHNPSQQPLKDFCTEVENWITPILQRQIVRV